MTRKRKQAIALVLGMFCVVGMLFLVSSTDLVLKEKRVHIYNISILLPTTGTTGWDVFRKGVDTAAFQLNADVNMITLYDTSEPAAEQRQLAQREIDSGVDALVIFASDPKDMNEFVDSLNGSTPVVIMDVPLPTQEGYSVLRDYAQAGALLQQAVAKAQGPVYFVTEKDTENLPRTVYIYNQLSAGMQRKMERLPFSSGEGQTLWVKGLAQASVLLVAEPSLAQGIAAALESTGRTDVQLLLLGNTSQHLSLLEKKQATAVFCTNEMEFGYRSIQAAVNALNGKKHETVQLAFTAVWAETMFEQENQVLLFPVS